MWNQRLKATTDSRPRLCMVCTSSVARWHVGLMAMLLAAFTVVVMPAAVAASNVADIHVRRYRGRPVPTSQGNGGAFVTHLSSAAVWASFRREHTSPRQQYTPNGFGSNFGDAGLKPHDPFISRLVGGLALGLLRGQQPPQRQGLRKVLRTSTSRRASVETTHATGVEKNSSSPSSSAVRVALVETKQSVEGTEATVSKATASKSGRLHTKSSKAKISAANKGKKPWNLGGRHSEETRRKIAESARNHARKKKEASALALVRNSIRISIVILKGFIIIVGLRVYPSMGT